MSRRNWTHDETLLAFNLYCKTQFGKIHDTNPEIIELAGLIGRTPASVTMKMCNLASHDPVQRARGVKGLAHGCKMEEMIWHEFNADGTDLILYAEELLAKYRHKKIEDAAVDYLVQLGEVEQKYILERIPAGEDRKRIARQRIGQYFFRKAVLSSYSYQCCITGIKVPELLVASHIKPWSVSDDTKEKTNPRNGLCLNALHDKAFDCGLITLNKDYAIVVSSKLHNKKIDDSTRNWIVQNEDKKIILPQKFMPDLEFIQYHNDVVFQK